MILPYTVRSGMYGKWKYDPRGVKVLPDGRVQLNPGSNYGAGIEFDERRLGVYEVTCSGRWDGLNPNAIAAVWLFDPAQPAGNELDLEILQGGNQSNVERTLLSCYLPGLKQVRKPIGSHEKHKVTLSYEKHVSRVLYQVWDLLQGKWIAWAFLEVKKENLPGCNLRITVALKDNRLMAGTAKGNNVVTVDSVAFTAA